MIALVFRVYGIAQGMGSKRAFVPKGWTRPIVTDTNRNLKGWQSLVADAAGRAITERTEPWRLLEGPIRLSVAFYLPRPQSLTKKVRANTKAIDVDKACRAIGDALSGVVYRDDRLIVELIAGKYYAAEGEVPHVDVRVEPTAGIRPTEWPVAPAPLFQEPLFSAEG